MELWNYEVGRIEMWFATLIIILAMAVSMTMPWLVTWNIILVVCEINMIVVQWHSLGGHDDDVDYPRGDEGA